MMKMIDKEDVEKIAPAIMGVCHWSIVIGGLYALQFAEKYLPEGQLKNSAMILIYGGIIGTAIGQFIGRRRRAKAKIFRNGVRLHDPDSGREMHYEAILRINMPNLLVNPFAIFAPMMAIITKVAKNTGSVSVTPKKVSMIAKTDDVCWNLGSNEYLVGEAAIHLSEFFSYLEQKEKRGELCSDEADQLEGIRRMEKEGLKIR